MRGAPGARQPAYARPSARLCGGGRAIVAPSVVPTHVYTAADGGRLSLHHNGARAPPPEKAKRNTNIQAPQIQLARYPSVLGIQGRKSIPFSRRSGSISSLFGISSEKRAGSQKAREDDRIYGARGNNRSNTGMRYARTIIARKCARRGVSSAGRNTYSTLFRVWSASKNWARSRSDMREARLGRCVLLHSSGGRRATAISARTMAAEPRPHSRRLMERSSKMATH